MAAETKVCVVTGAGGYVGGQLKRRLEREGWRVKAWTRQPGPGSSGASFQLGQDIDPGRLKGVHALIHCAYDFGPMRREDIFAVNVTGSQKLLESARKAGVGSVVFISSISAFAGCRSLYGKAKLEIEGFARSAGAMVIRPGLVYSDHPGGMFGKLVEQVRRSRFIPILWGGKQKQYLVHDEDLGNLVLGCLNSRVPVQSEPITMAHDHGWELKELLKQIAQALGRKVSFAPVPWQVVWLALKSLESAGAQPAFRSDSLISMVYQNPTPSFALPATLGYKCRPFNWAPPP